MREVYGCLYEFMMGYSSLLLQFHLHLLGSNDTLDTGPQGATSHL